MSLKESDVTSSLLALVGMCMFIENCILNAMGHSCVHDHSKSSIASASKNQNLIKAVQKWADFLLLTGLPNTIFEAEMHFMTLVPF